MDKYVYHITKRSKLESIMRDGLIPQIGDNSELCDEPAEVVYLCKESDIPYWVVLLDGDVVLRIENEESEFVYRRFDCYGEFRTHHRIYPDKITEVPIPATADAKLVLQREYLLSLSREIVYVVTSWDKGRSVDFEMMSRVFTVDIEIMSKLNYETLDRELIKGWLSDEGNDGEYTLLDTFMNTPKRLYEVLAEIDNPIGIEQRVAVYNFLKEKLDGCLDINTGGYCY